MADYFSNKYKNCLTTFLLDERIVELVSNCVDKYLAVQSLAKKLNISVKKIYSIGDDVSDYNMIKNFNGFCMKKSIEKVKNVAQEQMVSVSDLIERLLNDELYEK